MAPQTILDITVSPKSSRNKICVDHNNNIKIYLTAPPVDGKANEALISLLSKTLKISKSSIAIVHGESGKKKRICINGMTATLVMEMIKTI
jgi:uncharacterized protein